MALPKEVLAACKVLGISPDKVMASRVAEEYVVIIEGPVGYKRIVPLAEIAALEVKKETEAATEKKARKQARKGKK